MDYSSFEKRENLLPIEDAFIYNESVINDAPVLTTNICCDLEDILTEVCKHSGCKEKYMLACMICLFYS